MSYASDKWWKANRDEISNKIDTYHHQIVAKQIFEAGQKAERDSLTCEEYLEAFEAGQQAEREKAEIEIKALEDKLPPY